MKQQIDGVRKRVSREIGLKLRARRNEIDLTQTELAKKIGVSQQQVNKYEAGVGRIPADQLGKLCGVLGLDATSLFSQFDSVTVEKMGFAETEQTPFVNEAFADKDTMKLVRAFQSVENKNVRKKILRLIEAMADEEGDADDE